MILLGLSMPMSYAAMVFPLMLLGFSFGSAVTVSSDLVLTSASADRVGAATGISETAFELGTALSIAITGSAVALLYLLITGRTADFSESVDRTASPGAWAATASRADWRWAWSPSPSPGCWAAARPERHSGTPGGHLL